VTGGALPNLLIIGAAKSGTTALHRYLALHPEVCMSEPKELKLFNRDDWRDALGWYRSHCAAEAPVRGESSPTYSMDPWLPGVPARIREVAPGAKLVYVVRDPVERLVAQWVEMVHVWREDRPLAEALADYDSPGHPLVMPSRYMHQLDRYREHFPDAQILVVDHGELRGVRAATLRAVLEFLGVDPSFTTPDFDAEHNTREGKRRANRAGLWMRRRGLLFRAGEATRVLPRAIREPLKSVVAPRVETPQLDDGLRAELKDYLADDVAQLRAYTGKAFAGWSV